MASLHPITAERQLSELRLTCTNHIDAQRAALQVVRNVIPFDVGIISTIDPATLLWTSCVLDAIGYDPEREDFIFNNEYLDEDLLKITSLLRQSKPAGRISAFSKSQADQSPRFQMALQLGAVDELRSAIILDGQCWASFDLYRSAGSRPFTDHDVDLASSLSRPLAQIIRTSMLRQAMVIAKGSPDAPGLLILDDRQEVVSMTSTWQQWNDEFATENDVPPVVRSLVIQRKAQRVSSLEIVIPRRSGGWARVHALGLGQDDRETSVIVEAARAPEVPQSIAEIYGFTEREKEVISCIAHGWSAKETASYLGISTYTVNDHSKAIFHKAGVQSRQQLIARLYFDHCLPLREDGKIPSPYGWFLEKDSKQEIVRAGD